MQAQNDPLCFQLYFPVEAATEGDTVCLPLRVRDFQQIVSMQFAVSWDSSDLEFIRVDLSGSDMPIIGFNDLNTTYGDHLRFVWYDLLAMGVSMPDESEIFSICFRVKTNVAGFYPLQIQEVSPFSPFEVVMTTLPNWTPVQMPFIQQIGGVAVSIPTPGDLAIQSTCVSKAICGAPQGSASVEVTGGTAPYTYYWTGPDGFSASGASLDSITGGTYFVIVSDQNGASVTAQMDVSATPPDIYVSADISPAFCGQPTGCASLNATGANPPFTFEWSTVNSQEPSLCNLSPGLHPVYVDDALGCSRLYMVSVPNETEVQVAVTKVNVTDCQNNGSASVEVLKGEAPFTFLWSDGQTSQVAVNLSEGIYTVTVTAAGGCSTEASAWIFDLSISYWNVMLEKQCSGPNEGDLFLRFNPNGGVNFPAIVSWSDGSTRLIETNPGSVYLDTLGSLPAGAYSATLTDAYACSVSVQTVLNCAAPLPVPDSLTAFYIKDDYLNPQYGLDSCVGVYARYFEEVTSLEMTLDWDENAMELKGLKNLNLPGLSVANFNNSQDLKMSWSDPAALGVSLPENTLLFEVCFEPALPGNNYSVEFTEGHLVTAPLGEVPFLGMNGYAMFDLFFPAGPSVCAFAATPPACTSDGFARILLEGCDDDDAMQGWYSHNGQNYDGLEGLMYADSGSYYIEALQNAQFKHSLYAYIPGTTDSSDCVWPGDADNNSAVNHHDLLYLGLAYGTTGPARSGGNIDWEGQDCPAWAQSTATRQVNYKNIDANGDGVVNAADTVAIVQNWSRVIDPTRHNPFDAPLGNPTGNPEPPFTILSDTLAPGQAIALPMFLGSEDMPVDSIYGLAFSISYDPRKIQPNPTFFAVSSWLGDTSNLLWLQRNFPQQGRLDVAITRTDGLPVTGWGYIGDVFVIIEDDIFLSPGGDDEAESSSDIIGRTTLFFSGLHPIGSTATPGMLDAPPVELVIAQQQSSAQQEPAWAKAVLLSPNPTSGMFTVSSPGTPIQRIEVLHATTGAVVATAAPGNAEFHRFDAQTLPSGTWFVRIFSDKGVAIRKISIIH